MSVHQPLVSIFVISYNGKDFLREAIESFIAQTYKNIEICVSDDASTDGTHELLLEYKQKLGDRFKYNINPTNLGITKNANKCLELCSGDYIAYCGGDDLFLPEKVEQQVNYLNGNTDSIAAYSNVEIFDSNTEEVLNIWSSIYKTLGDASLVDVINKGCFFCACSVMVRNKELPRFNERLPVASDWFQMVEILQLGGKLGYIDKTLSRYRRHSRNVTNKEGNLLSQAENDTIHAYIQVLCNHPEYVIDIMVGLSRFFRGLGKYKDRKYYKVAFLICPWHWKNIIMFLKTLFFASMKVS